jgi:hypothetical protein
MISGGQAAGYGAAARPKRRGLAVALAGAAGAALACAAAWAAAAWATQHSLTVLALPLGAVTGAAVRRLRPGDRVAAAGSALLAVAGCAAGSFLAIPFALAGAGVSVSSITAHLDLIARGYPATLGALTIACWAAAAVLGFLIPALLPPRRPDAPWRQLP